MTSDIEQLCFCVDEVPNCGLKQLGPMNTYPGLKLQVSVVAVGQLNGTNPGIVLSNCNNNLSKIAPSESIQQIGVDCTHLNYTIHSFESTQFEIILSINLANGKTISDKAVVVTTRKCPRGFELNEDLICVCHSILEKYGVSCSLESESFRIPSNVWIGYNGIDNEFLVHSNCPPHHCRAGRSDMITLDALDSQCMEGFSGTLCSTCQHQYSSVLGAYKCKKCSSLYVILVVVICIIAAPLMIAAMLYGNLTIDSGFFNGALLYVNIIHIHRSVFFPLNRPNVVTVFIAWLNLDLGVELCFYNGLDFFTRAWLQYVFPAYLISLAVVLICLNWYSTLGAKLIGNRSLNVLASSILLCYTNIFEL